MRLKDLWPALVAASIVVAACGGAEPPAQAPGGAERVDESRAATVTGRVSIEGAVPENPPIRPTADPFCVRETPQGARFETFSVSGGGLDNVFVYVKDSFGKYHFDIPTEPVTLDQRGCMYTPHVLGVRAGQPIEILNSDETLHNVHATADNNQPFNLGQPTRGIRNTRTFTAREVMVRVKCDAHPWMTAYVGVVEHPYFAVTSAGGRFELKKLPAGTYTVEAWHEKLGTQSQTVTLADNESKAITFTFAAPAAPAN